MPTDKSTHSVPLDTGDDKDEVIAQQNVGPGVERGGGEFPEPGTPAEPPAPGSVATSSAARSTQTITEVLEEYEAQGFDSQFMPDADSNLRCLNCNNSVPADEIGLAALRRIEGVSDPDDMAAIAALECPRCGAKGTVALKYGPGASIEEADILGHLEQVR
jgi:hypothetical protein